MNMERMLTPAMRKMMNRQIDDNPWMEKLIGFYKEEMGSGSDDSGSSGSGSSSGSATSSKSSDSVANGSRTS